VSAITYGVSLSTVSVCMYELPLPLEVSNALSLTVRYAIPCSNTQIKLPLYSNSLVIEPYSFV
jgi:hypothetical protein